MKQHKRRFIVSAILVFVLSPAVAAHGGSHSVGAQSNDDVANTRLERQELRQERRELARQTRQERIDTIKQEVEQRKATIKQDVCERRQERLQTALPRLANGATSVKNAIDTMYTRVQGFYESGQLTVANYDELTATIDSSKADAETSLEAIESYEFELDCENANVGEQLDAYRTAVKDAKESLKVYRNSLVELISALRSESASDDSSTETEEEAETQNDTSTEGDGNE